MSAPASLAASLASRPPAEREAILADLSDAELEALEWDWPFWARPDQLAPPGDWNTWLALAGRGWGKTRSGAEWVRGIKASISRIALVAPTAADVRDVIVEGESGILATSPPWDRPVYEPSKRRLTWANGAQAALYSADEPDRLRGPQHGAAWCDELAAWRYPEAWDMLQFGLRLGTHPRAIVTTTPKPVALIRNLLRDPGTVVTRGRTLDNAANLAATFLTAIQRKYAGTRLGRQELDAEMLDDVPGALWTRAMLDALRATHRPDTMRRCVVGLDPAVTSGEDADETGIVAAGTLADGTGIVLEDESCRDTPDGWARRAVALYHRVKADRIVAEVNNGGDLVEAVIRTVDRSVPVVKVHASRGKAKRAEPVAALYEQGRVRHLGAFPAMEDQMCAFTADFDPAKAGYSPDRMDALVWALTDLMVEPQPAAAAVRPLRL